MTRLEQLKLQRTLTVVLGAQFTGIPHGQFITADTNALNTFIAALDTYANYLEETITDISEV